MKCQKFNRERSFAEKFNRITNSQKKAGLYDGAKIGHVYSIRVILKVRRGAHCTRLGRVISSLRINANLTGNITMQKSFKNLKKNSDYQSLCSRTWG